MVAAVFLHWTYGIIFHFLIPWRLRLHPTSLWIALALASAAEQPRLDSERRASSQERLRIGPPRFPAHRESSTSCHGYLRALVDSNCTRHVSETLPVTLYHCSQRTSPAAAGILALQRSGGASAAFGDQQQQQQQPGTAIYRIRVIGPAGIWLLEPTYCRHDLALATYNLTQPGHYTVEVLMLYTSFVFSMPNASVAVQQPWAGYLTLEAPSSTADGVGGTTADAVRHAWGPSPNRSIFEAPGAQRDTATGSSSSSYRGYGSAQQRSEAEATALNHDDNDDGDEEGGLVLPLCPDTGPLPGCWRPVEWPTAGVAPLLRSCVWGSWGSAALADDLADCRHPLHRPLMYGTGTARLRWQPYGCRMRPICGITPHPSAELLAAAAELERVGIIHISRQQQPQHKHQPPQQQEIPQWRRLWHVPYGSTRAGGAGSSHLQRLRQLRPQGNSRGRSSGGGDDRGEVSAATCLPPGRHICFIGDSHARYLHHTLISWHSGFQVLPNNSQSTFLPSAISTYHLVRWGPDMPTLEPDGADPLGRNCTDVVVNFGQWHASFKAGSAPYSAASYLKLVRDVRQRLLRLRWRYGVRPYWMTTAMSSLKANHEVTGTDWRSEPMLLLYNRLAADLMGSAVTASERRNAGGDSHTPRSGGIGWSRARYTGPQGNGRRRALSAVPQATHGTRDATRVVGRREEQEEGGAKGALSGGAMDAGVGVGSTASPPYQAVRRRRGQEVRRQRGFSEAAATRGAGVGTWALDGGLLVEERLRPQRRPRSEPSLHLLGLLREALQSPNLRGRAAAKLRKGGVVGGAAGAAEAGIPIIDTWSPSHVLYDTTWDGVHYANTGAVGLAQFGALLHALCSEAVLEEMATTRWAAEGR